MFWFVKFYAIRFKKLRVRNRWKCKIQIYKSYLFIKMNKKNYKEHLWKFKIYKNSFNKYNRIL